MRAFEFGSGAKGKVKTLCDSRLVRIWAASWSILIKSWAESMRAVDVVNKMREFVVRYCALNNFSSTSHFGLLPRTPRLSAASQSPGKIDQHRTTNNEARMTRLRQAPARGKRMTKESSLSNDERTTLRHLSFVIDSGFVIRISSFISHRRFEPLQYDLVQC